MVKVLKLIDNIVGILRMSLLKFGVSMNLLEKSKSMKFDNLLFFTSLYGAPISHRMLSNIYASSGEKELRKALKKIDKLVKNISRENRAYTIMLTQSIQSVKNCIISALETPSINDKIKYINTAINLLSETRNSLSEKLPIE